MARRSSAKKKKTTARKSASKSPVRKKAPVKKPPARRSGSEAAAPARPPAGSFVWHELMTTNVEGAKKFYSALFGWKYEEMNMGQFAYTMFNAAGKEPSLGGMMPMEGPDFEGVPPHWMTYVAVDDVDAAARKCQQLGGRVCVPPTDIPNSIGRFAVLTDPAGASIAVYRSSRW